MSFVSDHAISGLWPAKNPDILQLYSFPTPNGIKVSAMLEETGIAYEAHTIKLNQTETPEFLALNPNNKIPAIIDPTAEGGPVELFESGAILIYLAEKTGQFMPTDAAGKAEVIQWLMWQMGGLGPMSGQVGFFHKFAGSEYEDKRPLERYLGETNRLLRVLDGHLAGRDFIAGNAYSIADMASWPWVRTIRDFYEAGHLVELDARKNVASWVDRCADRPASQRALNIPDRDG